MLWWARTLAVALFLHAGYCHSKYIDQDGSSNLLHHQMTDGELERYFGASSADQVPEYEITHPFRSNEKGEFISHRLSQIRRRRTPNQPSVIYYYLKAFGVGLHLNVTLNEDFLHPKFVIETKHKNGSTSITTPAKADYFTGNVISHQGSIVAMSRGKGLMGMIKLLDETFFVQPIPTHLSRRHKRSLSSTPHIILRRSAMKKSSPCQQEDNEVSDEVTERIKRSTMSNIMDDNSSSTEQHKYLQTVYVVDQYALDFLGQSTLEIFLPTLANIVAGIFRDDSFGKIKLNYVLKKIVFPNSDEFAYFANATALTKLDFIKLWARNNNPKSESPEHFDTVTLLSRGELGGRAVPGTICTGSPETSNVVNMAGINSAGTIAHEVFHNFGYHHDSTTECPNLKYIMATSVSSGPASFTWSNCSREFAQDFLSSGASDCLNDPPSATIQRPTEQPGLKTKLPGVVFDADHQCQLQYGSSYHKCPTQQNQCDSLYCTPDYKKCLTNYAPPLDGTRCGLRSWCIEGVCVDDGSPMIDGKWSSWSDYGSCTRTCGGGVQFQTRKCDNPSPQNGGKDCEGSTRGNYRMCNTQACAQELTSFRQLQCAAKGNYKEHIATSDPCSLVCQSGNYIYWLGTVTDGTRCSNDKKNLDVCVQGHCQEVGCDYVLNSGKRHDRCRVCGGDGSSCQLNTVEYTKQHLDYGYAKADTMVTLPVHSTNVVAINRVATYNNLGVQTIEGEYLIDLPTWSRTVETAGMTISYIHEDNRYQDKIYIPGPTTQPIRLVYVYLYEWSNANVSISYYSPMEGEQAVITKFEWRVSSWSDCSRSCAGGLRTRLLTCVREDDKTEAGVGFCKQSNKPSVVESCNKQACPPEWYVSPWQQCSLSCGKGTQERSVVCRKKESENEWTTLTDVSLCPEPKPDISPLLRDCNQVDCPPEYIALQWSECSTTCSPGMMTRNLQCQRRNELGVTEILPGHWCEEHGSIKPPTKEACNTDSPCKPPPHVEIACFKLDTTIFPSVLANFQDTLDYENVMETVQSCAKLAHENNYEYFGLANNGECRVGPNIKSNFYKPPLSNSCSSSVGKANAIFVYTLAELPKMSPLGCYADRPHRALPKLLKDFRNQIVWSAMNRTVNQCAQVAYRAGYTFFSVQYWGECWSAVNADSTYDRYGHSTSCWEGVGGDWTNFVYRFN